ncbi:hypothetical protein ETAA8_57070 [Anatilimnocola aggregata]|uniref:Uncharacterized protein n=1 Tax=Anatilimnocola aggregata TaxID=2528021 RepID=A0A517YK10_9BACT|nr:hypothetical protein [Anatilimnocola aggregata]QDU30561.1 hypothetical protein ETAA8_57070 [Anatilimnocola aggregata]
MADTLILCLLLGTFAAFWIGLLNVIAVWAGWKELARRYPDDGSHEGQTFRFQSGAMNGLAKWSSPCNYGSCLNLRVCPAGLRIAVMFPFHFGHSPLFIPWSEFRQPTQKQVWHYFTFFEAVLGEPPFRRITLPSWIWDFQQEGAG